MDSKTFAEIWKYIYFNFAPEFVLVSIRGNKEASQEALVVKDLLTNAGDMRDAGSVPRLGRRAWLPTPVFLPGESMDRGAWWATVHRVAESQTQLK